MPTLNNLPLGSPLDRSKEAIGVLGYLDPKSAVQLKAVNKDFYAHKSLQSIKNLISEVFVAKAVVSSNRTDVYEKTISFCKVASLLAKLGATHEALGAFQQATDVASQSRHPIDVLCTVAIHKLKAKLIQSAKETFQQAKERAGNDALDLRTVAFAMAEAGFFDDALNIANALPAENKGIKSEILSKIGVAYGKDGRSDAAKKAFSEALKIARSIPNKSIAEDCLRSIVQDQISVGFLDDAEETAQTIGDNERNESRLYALRDVAVGYAEAGNVDYAGFIATNKIAGVRSEYTPSWLGQIAVAQVTGGGIKQAETTLNRSKVLFDRHGGSENANYTNYNAVLGRFIHALIEIGELDEAKVRINQYECSALKKSELLLKIAVKQAQSGFTEKAQATFSEVRQLANEDALSTHEQSEIVSGVVSGLADAGFFGSAIATVNDCFEGYPDEKSQKLSEIAEKQAKAGLSEHAQATFGAALAEAEGIVSLGLLAREEEVDKYFNRLSVIASKQADAGFIDQALQTLEMMVPRYLKISTVQHIGTAPPYAGQKLRARPTILKLSPDPQKEIDALLHIAIAQAHADQKDRARATFDQAKQLFTENRYEQNDLARAQAQAGFFSEATKTANTIPDANWRKRVVLTEISDAQLDEAGRIIELEFKESSPEP